MANNYDILLSRLDDFIKKYYKNKLIRGGIYFSTTALAFYLVTVTAEYYGQFGILIRSLLFWSYLLINISIFIVYIVIPLFNLYRIGKTINHEQAAIIIGKHFPMVKDKLLNVLQLKHLSSNNEQANRELIEAGINQKSNELSPIPFSSAIKFSENKRFVKYLAIPVACLLLILLAAPQILNKATGRLIHHNVYFKPEAPFQFNIINKSLQTTQLEDFKLDVKLSGTEIPEQVFLKTNGVSYKLQKENTINFHHSFQNLYHDIHFTLIADGFESEEYVLKVLPNPVLLSFQIKLSYPSYIGKKPEILNNTGDIIIPEGTQVSWSFLTKETQNLRMSFPDTNVNLVPRENKTQLSRFIRHSINYTIVTSNNYIRNRDSLSYRINVVPDSYPEVSVEEIRDSASDKQLYFTGVIKDDYGFNKLMFYYNIRHESDSKVQKTKGSSLLIHPQITQQQFYHYIDMSAIGMNPGDEVEYYFEVWDNDRVNGSKSAKTEKRVYKLPSLSEMNKNIAEKNKEIKSDIDESLKMAKELQKDIDKLNLDLLEKKNVDWEQKKKMQNILDKQEQLDKKIKEIQEENKFKNNKQNELTPDDERLLEKQKQLEDLFEKIMTPEMKKLFEEMQQLLEKMDKEKMGDMLDKMKLSNKDIEKELDRNMELFKQLEFEQKLEQTIDQLDKLKEKQEQLSEQSLQKQENKEELQNKQEQLNKEFDNLQKDLQELDKKNKELENPNDLKSTEQEQKNIDQQQENSLQQLKQNKAKKASESQKKAAEEMEKLSNELQKMQEDMQEEGAEEDINTLRGILENTLKISFDQEALIKDVMKTSPSDPRYLLNIQHQKKLKDDSKVVEDSLLALSKRVIEIKTIVNREISAINNNMNNAIELLANRQSQMAAVKQQYAMTSLNNLALLLSEALNQMQQQNQQQQQQKKNGGQCKKGGKGKPGGKMSMKSMRQLQENINKQLEELKSGSQKGKKSGEGKAGMSEKLSKLAAQQEALRNELRRMAQELKNNPNGESRTLEKMANEMEKTEKDIVNKLISNETIKRQQEILTRLLEAEKAERERDTEEKRESNEAKEQKNGNPLIKIQYKLDKLKEKELLHTVPPSLSPFYKKKVSEYFNKFGDSSK